MSTEIMQSLSHTKTIIPQCENLELKRYNYLNFNLNEMITKLELPNTPNKTPYTLTINHTIILASTEENDHQIFDFSKPFPGLQYVNHDNSNYINFNRIESSIITNQEIYDSNKLEFHGDEHTITIHTNIGIITRHIYPNRTYSTMRGFLTHHIEYSQQYSATNKSMPEYSLLTPFGSIKSQNGKISFQNWTEQITPPINKNISKIPIGIWNDCIKTCNQYNEQHSEENTINFDRMDFNCQIVLDENIHENSIYLSTHSYNILVEKDGASALAFMN